MSSPRIVAALEQFQSQVGSVEQVVLKLIHAKNHMNNHMNKVTTELMSIPRVNSQLRHTPIAIIGMAGVFPQARNLEEYWENILHEVDCITEVPASRWDVDAYYDPDPRSPDKTYCKRGGFIPDLDFNPMEFGLPPNLLEVTDISQLLSLVIAKQALTAAGYGESRQFDRSQTGITLGVAVGRQLATPLTSRLQYPIWERVLKSRGISDQETQQIIETIKLAYVDWQENAFPGLLGNVVAGRIANRLDLGGTNCVIDAACASSLAAFKMAVSELVEHRCNLMLTGGVDTDNSIFTYLCFSKTPALSLKQQSRPFDADADGILLGEGIGMVVLKRLADAERDGDTIYAVVKGIGSSSDGRFKSIYAPRPEGQVKALQRAYQDAGIAPDSVGLIEAHGTGTLAGDPAEFESLKQVFAADNASLQTIALGSVKSQIGHTKAAAGAASLIKVVLALHHKILPPTINVTQPNPKLALEDSPFYLNTKTRPWIQANTAAPRRAGVSSFGFGGTNFHVVLEEYRHDHEAAYRLHKTPEFILLFAATPERLLSQCQEVLSHLRSSTSEQQYAALIESGKSTAIPESAARLGFIAASVGEAIQKLETAIAWLQKQPQMTTWEHPQGIYYRETGLELTGKVVALFSGQGSQYLNMGRELVINFPELRQTYAEIDSLFLRDGLKPVSQVVFPPPVFSVEQEQAQAAALRQTDYAQPAIAAMSAGLYKLWQRAGFQPDFVAGHSFGELTALWAAGVLTEPDYFALVKARGQAMAVSDALNGDRGAMLAVKGELVQIEALLPQFPHLSIANWNSDSQVVLAGARPEIERFQQAWMGPAGSTVLLPVAAAFHTPRVAHAQKPFAQAIEAIPFNSPSIPVYTNVTGKRYPTEPTAIQKLLKDHLLNQVLFKQEIETIYGEGGYCFIEFGPKGVLTKLVKEILGDRPHLAVALNLTSQKDSDRLLRDVIVQLRVAGLKLYSIDPYSVPRSIPKTEIVSALTVRLGASNYVSDKTHRTFAQALSNGSQNGHQNGHSQENAYQNGHQSMTVANSQMQPQPQSARPEIASHVTNGSSIKPAVQIASIRSSPEPIAARLLPATAVVSSTQLVSQPKTPPMSDTSVNSPRFLEGFEHSLAQLNHHQSQVLQVHSQYLSHQMESTRLFFHLMQQQNLLFTNHQPGQSPEVQLAVLQSVEHSMTRFHDHQSETLRIHQQSLQHQAEYTQHLFALTQRQCQMLVDNQRTGMPTEWLPATATQTLTVPVAQPDLLPKPVESVKTPELVLSNRFSNGSKGASKSSGTEQMPMPTPERHDRSYPVAMPQPHTTIATPEPAIVSDPNLQDWPDLGQTLLAIVSDKTGYPVEMLELEMDMEADLGIDSIKRVEILGALQAQFPIAAQPNPEDLAELRTLGQIVAYLERQLTEKNTEKKTISPQMLVSNHSS